MKRVAVYILFTILIGASLYFLPKIRNNVAGDSVMSTDLPISFDIAWYEQKAVAVLLALLHLGFKNLRLGPTLPAFLSPNVAAILMKMFDIKGISDPQTDIDAMLQGK